MFFLQKDLTLSFQKYYSTSDIENEFWVTGKDMSSLFNNIIVIISATGIIISLLLSLLVVRLRPPGLIMT